MKPTWREPGIDRGFARAGLTVIELVLVLCLLGILFSITVVALPGLAPMYRVRSASRTLGAMIEELRALAIANGRPLGIRYTLNDNPHFYQIVPPAPEDAPEEPIESRKAGQKNELPETVRFRRILFPGGGSVDRGTVNVIFSPLGNSGSHVATLEGRGRDGQPILISVKFNAITGSIDFVEGEAGFQHYEG